MEVDQEVPKIEQEEVIEQEPIEKDEELREEDEDDDTLPFPNARVVRMMRKTIGNAKQIRSEVKREMK